MSTRGVPFFSSKLHLSFRIWIWSSILFSVAACIAISWVQFDRRVTMDRTRRVMENVRDARIDLAKGFLCLVLSADPQSPYRREQGLALLDQAMVLLRASEGRVVRASGAAGGSAARTDGIAAAMGRFRGLLDEFNATPAGSSADLQLRLRIAFHDLENHAAALDVASQRDVVALVEQFDREFALTIAIVIVLLGGMSVGAYMAGRRQVASIRALRESEAFAKTVFDSVDDSICVLDERGVITAVNERWRHFAQANSEARVMSAENVGVGADFLAVCPSSVRQSGHVADQFRDGIQDVIDGRRGQFQLEYPCTIGEEEKWFSMKATPLGPGRKGVVVAMVDVTQRKQMEESLVTEALRRRILIEGSRDGIVVLDQQGKVFEANLRFAEMLGYASDEVGRLHVWDWDRDWPPERVVEAIRSMGPEGARFESRHWRKDGTILHVELSNSVAELGGRKLVFCVCHDITERKRTEEALQKEQSTLRGILDATKESVWLFDPDGVVLIANETAAKRYGIPLARVLGRNFRDFMSPETARSRSVHFEEAIRSKRPLDFEDERAGTRFHHSLYPIFGVSGKVTGVVCYSRDITEQQQAEAALRASEEKYRNLFDNMAEEVHFWHVARDAAGRIETWRLVDANPPALKTWGRRRIGEVRGKTADEIFGPGATEHFRAVVEKIMTEGAPHSFEDYLPHLDRHFRFTSVPVGEYFITTGADITGIKRAEAALLQRLELQDQLAKVAATAPGMVFSFQLRPDGSACLPFCTPVIRDLWGFRPEELRDDFSAAFARIHPDDVTRVRESIDASASGLKPWREVFRVVHPQRGELWIEANSLPRREQDGSTLWHGVAQDVTVRMRRAEEIARARDFYVSLLENAPALVWRSGADDKCDWFNKTWLAFTGRKMEQEIGDGWLENVHPDDRDGCVAQYRKALDERRAFSMEYRLRRHDGEFRWIVDQGTPFNTLEGRYGGYIGYCYDVTERRNAEDDLRRANAHAKRLNSLLRSIHHVEGLLAGASERKALLQAVCESLVKTRGYVSVWFGEPQKEPKSVVRLAEAGVAKGVLREVPILWDDSPLGDGPTGLAVRERSPAVFDDLAHDPRFAPWRDPAAEGGAASIASVPLVRGGEVCGVLTVVADYVKAFDSEEIKLLTTLTGNLGSALERIDKSAALRKSEMQLRLMIEHSPAAIAMLDADMRYLVVSRRWLTDYRLPERDVTGRCHYDVFPEIPERLKESHRRCLAGAVEKCDADPFPRADGSTDWVRWEIRPWYTDADTIGGMIIFSEIITDRIKADSRIKESEARYRLLAENGTDMVWLYDLAKRRFSYVSPAVERMRGYTVREVLQQGMQDALTPESYRIVAGQLPERLAAFHAGDESARTRTHEVDQTRKDGTTVSTEVVTTLIPGADGRVTHIQGVARDVSERRRAEASLRESETRLRTILQTTQDAFWLMDMKGRIEDVNDAACRMHGYTREEMLKLSVDDFDLHMTKGGLADRIQEATRQGAARFEVSHRCKDGHLIEVEISATSLDLHGVHFVAFIRDITERKKAEAEIRRLAMAVEQAAESFVITDVLGTIQYVNPAFEKITGYPRREAVGRNPRFLGSGRQDKAFFREMWDTLLRGEVWSGNITNKRKDGTLYEEDAVISPVRDASGVITNFVAAKRDVTREYQLEQQIQQAQKMEAVGRLAGGVAHDFNNILQSVLGYCDLILEEMPVDDARRADIVEIRKSGVRAAALTRQLLAFSRQEVNKPVVLDMNGVVENVQKMLRRLIGEDIAIVLKLANTLPPVKADMGQIDQVIMNLVVNARDAMPEGGTLTISTCAMTFDVETTRNRPEARPGTFVCLAISDTGTGMSPAVQARIFEPFFSTKGSGKGTGLGLAVVFGIVKQHKGWINVYSQEGQGTTFKIFLPVTAEAATATAAASAAPPRGGGQHILLVEDEAPVRELAVRLLFANGYTVTAAATGEEAMTLFGKADRPWDMVFSDVVLPDVNGIALVEQMQQIQPTVPVLLSSGYSDERSRWYAIVEKKYRYLQKPYTATDLLQNVHELLHKPS